MSTNIRQFRENLKEPWLQALLLIALIPLFPEYISFVLVIPAVFLAWKDRLINNRRIYIGRIGKLLLAYIGYMFITTLYSKNFLHSLATVGMWAFFFLIYLVVVNILTDSDRCDSMLLCVTAVAGVVGLIACLQYRIGYFTNGQPAPVWEWLDNIVFEILPLRIVNPEYMLRSPSTFNNPNILAEYLVLVTPFVVYFNFCERRKDIRLFCRICLLLTFCGILFSFSRGGYMTLLVLCLMLIILNFRHRFAAISMYVFSAFMLIPDEIIKRLLSILPGIEVGGKVIDLVTTRPAEDSIMPPTVTTPAEIINNSSADYAITDRLRMWLECLNRIKEQPIFGYGAGVQNTWDILEEQGIAANHAHNFVLQILMEGGLIALAIMAWIGFEVIRTGVRLMRCGHSRGFWMGFAVTMFVSAFVIHGLVDYPFLTPKLVANFTMILAIVERALPLYEHKGAPLRDISPAFLFTKKKATEKAE